MFLRYSHIRQVQCQAIIASRQLARSLATTTPSVSEVDTNTRNKFIYRQKFDTRHIGVNNDNRDLMLKTIKIESMEDLVSNTIPHNIRMSRPLNLSEPMTEEEFLKYAKKIASQNQIFRSYIGMGYSNCHIPTVIQRNVFENPGWVTQYTPYQAELSQGRLENLLNFQTMICDLTGLDIANASLLDEATAAAEAMSLCTRSNKRTKFLISDRVHPQSIDLIKTRAEPLGIEVVVQRLDEMDFSKGDVSGFLFQYPDTDGSIVNVEDVIKKAKSANTIVVCAADLLSLCLLKSPLEIGADIALGNSQRFGVPLGFGGPHAAFFAAKDNFKREIPGRIIGISIDSNQKKAYRLTLQTREQHIRQGKATSNICTAQALLANMSAFYAIYHGPEGLRKKAMHAHFVTLVLAEGLKSSNNTVVTEKFFDTLKIKPIMSVEEVKNRSEAKSINFRYFDDQQHIGISLDETVSPQDINDILEVLGSTETFTSITDRLNLDESPLNIVNDLSLKRQSKYLQHSIFNLHHSEAELVRYMKTLENKDVSLVHSMIPLGSCTMKLNSTTELMPCSWPEFNAIHPFVPKSQVKGYHYMFDELCRDLCEITGYDKISLQPNSGSQGEYAGLRAIMSYLASKGENNRRVCLIPTSAHGTNPASAAMAGMKIVSVNVLKNGEIDMNHLKDMANKYKSNLACAMITYPSTYGVFDTKIVEICEMIHEFGGQIYLDGANLNAQVGLCRPGDYGSDVSHLNLHKTFCIPHGGGGPGMGPIGVKKHLAPFLPSHSIVDIEGVNRSESFGSCSAAPYGSSSILPISWAYIKMMGGKGLTKATEVAILNANYMKSRLENAYGVNYTGDNGTVAHEFIINADFKATANVEAIDVAKRLQDYGFHAPTVSWPVHGALMIEPTESENIKELDRYCDSLLMIREEIKKIETGIWDKVNNPLKNAPHIQETVISTNWDKPYSRETAAYPIKHLKPETKIWPTCGRVNDPYGDKHLVVKL